MLAVLVGASPAEGLIALSKLDIPYILLEDPGDIPPRILTEPANMVEGWTRFIKPDQYPTPEIKEPVRVVPLAFKHDPLSILSVPFPEPITHVFSFTELGQFPAALLAEALGVPTVNTATVLKTRNKFFMRRALDGLVDQPAFGLVDDKSVQDIPYPIVMKPVDGAGSNGVQYVDDVSTFKKIAVQGEMYLWEQYIEGPEFSVETVTFNGKHHILGITEKVTTGAPHFVEVGHLVPARLSEADVENITTTVKRCLDVLGINQGSCHTEVKYFNSRTFIIETHTRSGGDRITLLHELITGYDQDELAVRSILGMELPPAPERKFQCAGIHFFKWPTGIVAGFDGIDKCLSMPGVVELELELLEGNEMPQWQHSFDRPGYVLVGGESHEEVQLRLRAAEAAIRVRYA